MYKCNVFGITRIQARSSDETGRDSFCYSYFFLLFLLFLFFLFSSELEIVRLNPYEDSRFSVVWPSGLRRWFKAPVSLRRGFKSHHCHTNRWFTEDRNGFFHALVTFLRCFVWGRITICKLYSIPEGQSKNLTAR